MAFLIRVCGASIALISQALLARWMGASEFGIYAYVWTWVVLLGSLIDFGFATTAQRFVPEYIGRHEDGLLRGFLFASRAIVVAFATALALLAALAVRFVEPWIGALVVLPLYLGCLTLPLYGLTMVQDGIARSYNWMNLALMPLYIVRPLAILVLMGAAHLAGYETTAVTALIASIAATWATAIVQLFTLNRRLSGVVRRVGRRFDVGRWMVTSLPVFMVGSFYFLLTYTDVLVLEQFRAHDEVAIYYAATKILALVAFIYFSIWAVAGTRFAELNVAGERDKLAAFLAWTIRWMFWPSLAATAALLSVGKPILWLFGPAFTEGYWLLAVLSVGLLARASVGPAERLLNMLGEERRCAAVYCSAFTLNVAACLILIPPFGMLGAALATSSALVAESAALYVVIRRRLGLHSFIVPRRRARGGDGPVTPPSSRP
jgi:O-antigen/teichoic acid export membrane protein